ncbi:MAG: hypothetical protein CL468_00845 [Acidimicrobiaceae bacterium]|nr:hypothetical protein [Acidimicrobiaceae bacterium]
MLPDPSTATAGDQISPGQSVGAIMATVPSAVDQAPAVDPASHNIAEAASTAVTALRSRRRVVPGAGSERAVTR